MRKFTVHMDIQGDLNCLRNDHLVKVTAKDIHSAIRKAQAKVRKLNEYDAETMETCEILEVYAGHVKALWNRAYQCPAGDV